MKLDSMVQQCILVRPGMRRPPSECHLVPIRREFCGYAVHIFLRYEGGLFVVVADEVGKIVATS
jgi:hypothetical protein